LVQQCINVIVLVRAKILRNQPLRISATKDTKNWISFRLNALSIFVSFYILLSPEPNNNNNNIDDTLLWLTSTLCAVRPHTPCWTRSARMYENCQTEVLCQRPADRTAVVRKHFMLVIALTYRVMKIETNQNDSVCRRAPSLHQLLLLLLLLFYSIWINAILLFFLNGII